MQNNRFSISTSHFSIQIVYFFCRDEKKVEDDDPSKSIMNMMKKMYDEGDDEMKRTIAKAWTESRDKQMKGDDMMPPDI